MAVFFMLTFAVTWTAWAVSATLSAPSGDGVFGVRGPLFLAGVFAPGLVALALTAQTAGGGAASKLLARIGQWQVAARWYVFAVSYMAAVKLTAAAIQRVITGAWPPFSDTPWLVMLAVIPLSMWVQAGEEIGWRGYALPRLATRFGLGAGSILLGAIWALWHLPLFFMAGTDTVGQSFPIYLLLVVPVSVAISWLYWKTNGSLLLVMLMHASVNNTSGIVSAVVPSAAAPLSVEGSLLAWLTVGLAWIVTAVLLFKMRGGSAASMHDAPLPPAFSAIGQKA